jgi:hypothetical protein
MNEVDRTALGSQLDTESAGSQLEGRHRPRASVACQSCRVRKVKVG